MSNASANSSKKAKTNKKEDVMYTICPTAVEFGDKVLIIPDKNKKFEFSLEEGKEITLFQNKGMEKNGKTLILNEKTKKAFGKRRTIPKSLDPEFTKTQQIRKIKSEHAER